MEEINYTYEVLKVDEAARCMEILYKAPGHQDVLMSARLPFVGETVEDMVRCYSPERHWLEKTYQVVVPAVGKKGNRPANPGQGTPPNQVNL